MNILDIHFHIVLQHKDTVEQPFHGQINSQEKVVNYINKLAREQKEKGKKIGIIASDETKDLYEADEVVSVGQRAHLETVTAHLYDVLREFDHKDVDMIYSEGFEGEPLSEAIMNRMVKAAGHEILRI